MKNPWTKTAMRVDIKTGAVEHQPEDDVSLKPVHATEQNPIHRMIYQMAVEGKPQRDIAAAVNRSQGTVSSVLSQAVAEGVLERSWDGEYDWADGRYMYVSKVYVYDETHRVDMREVESLRKRLQQAENALTILRDEVEELRAFAEFVGKSASGGGVSTGCDGAE